MKVILVTKFHTKKNPSDMLTKMVSERNLHIVKSCSISFQLLELGGARLDELRMA